MAYGTKIECIILINNEIESAHCDCDRNVSRNKLN